MKYLPLLLTLLASCAHNTSLPITAPAKQPPVSQPINLVIGANQKTELAAQRVKDSAEQLGESVTTLKDQMDKVVSDADKMREAKETTQTQLDSFIQLLHEANTQVTQLSREYSSMKLRIGDLESALKDAKQAGDKARIAGEQKDFECSTLRQQNLDMKHAVADIGEENHELKKQLDSARNNAVIGSLVKWSVITLIGCGIIFALAKLVIAGIIPNPFKK